MSLSTYSDETISQLSIAYKYKVRTKSKIIYTVTVSAVIIELSILPLIYTQISVKSQGILQSDVEKTELVLPVSGRIITMKMKDNQKLFKGDTLLVIDASLPRQQAELLQKRSVQLNQLLQDVYQLLQLANKEDHDLNPNLKTGQYYASWQHFLQESEDRRNSKNQAERVFNRYDKLYKNKVLTTSEYEKFKFDYEQAISTYSLLTKRYRSQWQLEATEYRNELLQLAGQQAEITEQTESYTLTSPVIGSLQNLSGLQPGTYVFANQKIGEISPDTKLMAFCYIKPSDIGLIHEGQQVRFQINAFNYNQWGLLTGNVLDISDDIILLNGDQPVFKVKCSLDNDHLQLNSGYKGYVKKGMNFTARFMVTERSLFQLLYDKVDDWVNPNAT